MQFMESTISEGLHVEMSCGLGFRTRTPADELGLNPHSSTSPGCLMYLLGLLRVVPFNLKLHRVFYRLGLFVGLDAFVSNLSLARYYYCTAGTYWYLSAKFSFL